jgi:hypothetical protein
MLTKRATAGLVVIVAAVGALVAGATATTTGGHVVKSGQALASSVSVGSATAPNLPSEIYFD